MYLTVCRTDTACYAHAKLARRLLTL